MRFLKRLSRILILVLLLGGIGLGIMYHFSRLTPSEYMPRLLTDQQRYEMAQRVDAQKIPKLISLAAGAQNRANRILQGKTVDAKPETLTLSFTEDELNSTLWKWSAPYKDKYEAYVTDPYISLQENTIVAMATVTEFGRVLSAYIEPKLDDQGMLHCDIASLKVGSLPVPQGMVAKKQQQLENLLKAHLPAWQENAKIDPTGIANADAKAAALGKMVLQFLHHDPSPAVIFVKKDWADNRTIPVRLTAVKVEKGSLTITVEPMDAQQRTALLEQIRQRPDAPAVAAAKS